jgi:hypothetical protein
MDSKEKADVLIDLANVRTAMWKDRISNSWKVSLGVWALLAATAFYVKKSAVALYLGPFVFVGHTYFTVMVSARTRYELALLSSYIREIETLVLGRHLSPDYPTPTVSGVREWMTVLLNYSVATQSMATALILVGMYLIGA